MPAEVVAEVPIASGDERLGGVVLLEPGRPEPEAVEFLHLAAVAALTEVAVEEAREEVEENVRGSFLEDLRARPDGSTRADVVRRAGAPWLRPVARRRRPVRGAERGAAAARGRADRRASTRARSRSTSRAAGGRVYALLPAAGGDERHDASPAAPGAGRPAAAPRRRRRCRRFYADPAELGRAIQEAELVLEVLQRGDGLGGPIQEDIGTGTYRLLFRVLASHPEEVRSFYEDTVAAIVATTTSTAPTSCRRSRPTSSTTAT